MPDCRPLTRVPQPTPAWPERLGLYLGETCIARVHGPASAILFEEGWRGRMGWQRRRSPPGSDLERGLWLYGRDCANHHEARTGGNEGAA